MEEIGVWSREIWTGIALLSGSVMDVKTKKLPLWFLTVFGAGSIFLAVVWYPGEWQQKGIGLLLGASLLLVGRLSGCIGAADGLMVMALGVLYGGSVCGEQVMYAVFFTALTAIALIAAHRADAKSRLPFFPFLAAGFVVYLLRLLSGIGS